MAKTVDDQTLFYNHQEKVKSARNNDFSFFENETMGKRLHLLLAASSFLLLSVLLSLLSPQPRNIRSR